MFSVLLLSGPAVAQWDVWETHQDVPAPFATNRAPTQPSVAIDNTVVHVAFVARVATFGTWEVYYNSRTTGWGTPQRLSAVNRTNCLGPPPRSCSAFEPDIAVWSDAIGRSVYVVWTQKDANNPVGAIYLTANQNGGFGPWTQPIRVTSPDAAAQNPSVAVDENYVFVAFAQQDGSFGRRIIAARLNRQGALDCHIAVTGDYGYRDDVAPDLVVDKSGSVHVLNVVYQSRT
ncbi:MAG TPA: hypothetical protein VJ397_05235, partial [Thermoplasmata archaeon]|nr:hypothetical protein [Thermoplasmata archaeon]